LSDFNKIVDHPEKQEIISKLLSGDSPSDVSKYLKEKYPGPDQSHLRIASTILDDFIKKYASQASYATKLIKKDCESKLDKKIADSLLQNKEWSKRLAESVDEEIDFKRKFSGLLKILEVRAEQIFDLIQSNPESTKTDYIFTKYMELIMLAIEKGDKLINDKPDIKIEHSYTIQMVEQQSFIFQEAIRRVLERMGSEYSSIFMDLLNQELNQIKTQDLIAPSPSITPKQMEKEKMLLTEKTQVLEASFEDLSEDTFAEDYELE